MKNYYKLTRQVTLLAAFVLVMLNSFSQIQYTVTPAGGTDGNTDGTGADPVADYFNSIRYQVVYTVAELNAAGMQPGTILTALTWNVTELPGTLDNYSIKIGHTTAANSAAHDASPTTTVKNAFSYVPAMGMNDIVFDTPFMWNGTDNLLIDVCTGPSNPYSSPYGGVAAKTGITDGSRYIQADGSGLQCGNNTNTSQTTKPYVRLTGTPPPAAPPTPTQDPAPPTCSAGTLLDLAGPPPADVTWYWESTATGTSTATPYTGPYAVFNNGTYYARAYNTVNMVWSSTSSSITVSNFPLATAPPAPVADQNPACAPGTTLTEAAAPAGYEYYWQTAAGGTSTASDAATPMNITSTGTYYVAAYETASQCWSNTVSTAITVDTYVPAAPTAAVTNYNICSGTASQPIEANALGGPATLTLPSGPLAIAIPDSDPTGISTSQTISSIPAGATITDVTVNLNITHTFDGDLDIYLVGANGTQIELSTDNGSLGEDYINTTFSTSGAASITTASAPMTGVWQPEGSLPSLYSAGNGTWTLKVSDDSFLDNGTLNDWTLTVTYTLPPASVVWYDAASGGTNLGSGSPFESVGTSVLPNTTADGPYTFYAQAQAGGCASTTRLPITVNVTEVLAELTPVNVTCNGGDNGSFTLGTVGCGTGPFLYSLDGGTTFGAIPTDLTAGTYSVIMQDQSNMDESAPIPVVITEPAVPSALTVDDVTYYTATLSWTANGDESQWFIEYGAPGFTPGSGSGTTVTATSNPWTITGLSPNMHYDFYVSADCGGTNGLAGPQTISTNAGFLAWDNVCTVFNDISTTGTNNSLNDDDEIGVTLPFAFTYQGTAYTTLTIGNNGGIVFGTLTGAVGYSNGTIASIGTPGLYPFWDDMAGEGTGVFYEAIGTAPNQQFIIQWNKENLNGDEGDEMSFQIILDQATSEIYFEYDDVLAGGDPTVNYGESATIGASGPINIQVSMNDSTYLVNNDCVHFYYELCPNPVDITTQPFAQEAFVNWSAGPYGESDWTIVYGPAGFTPGDASTIDTLTSNTPSTSLENLTQLTTYDVYIYSECEADDLTSGGTMVSFTTLPNCSNPSNLNANTAADSLELTWNWNESDPAFPVSSFNIQYGMSGFTLYDNYDSIAVANGLNNADTITDAGLLAGGVYEVYVQAVCSATNDTSSFVGPITVVMPLTNDGACGAENLMVDGTAYTFNNDDATVDTGESSIAPPADGAQVTTGWTNSTLNHTTWFTFTAPASGSVRINNTGIEYNGQAAVYEVSDCGDFVTFALLAANDNAIGGTSVAPNFTICGLTPGATYYLMNDGFNSATGDYSISISPIVLEAGTANPVTDICTGATVDLFSTVSGEDAGGVWSSSIPAVNASINGSDLTSTGLAYQAFSLQYRVTDGCAYDSIMTQVHVFAPSSAGTDGTITACRNEPIDLLSGLNDNADLTGTWYDPSNTAIAGSAITTSNIPGQFNYDYIAGNGVCPNDTANVVVTVQNCDYLSIQEEMFNGVSLFPNPSEGLVFITSDVTEAFDYTITDMKGSVVAKANGAIKNGQQNQIDLSKAETGVYFIKLSNTQAQKVFRVVIQ